MKGVKFTAKQKERTLKMWIEEGKHWLYVCKKNKCTRVSLWRWKKQYDGTTASLENKSSRPKSPHPTQQTDKAMKKLLKVVEKVINGAVKYERVEIDDILLDKDEKGDKTPSMTFNAGGYLLKQNIIKAITFMLTTILMSVISFTESDTSIWQALLKNSTLLLGAIVSAITLSYNYIKLRTIAFEQRNDFMLSRMGIDISY